MFLSKTSKSFSVVELVVVMAILTIVLSVSVPRVTNLDRYFMLNELEKMFMTFSYLQQKAIAGNCVQELTFDETNRTFCYNGPNNKACVQILGKGVNFGFIAGVKGPPSNPTNLITKAITFSPSKEKPTVQFYPDGKIRPGTVYLVDKNKTFMGALTCPISGVSYMRKYRFYNKKWVVL